MAERIPSKRKDPPDGDQKGSPSKVLSFSLLREKSKGKEKETRVNLRHFYSLLTKNNAYEVIYCEKYEGQDAFMNPLRVAVNEHEQWLDSLGIICSMTRVISKTNGRVWLNRDANSAGNYFPRWIFLRVINNDQDVRRAERMAVLNQVAEVSKRTTDI